MNLNRRTIATSLILAPVLAGCLSTTGLRSDARPELKDTGVLLLPVTDRALFTATGATLFLVDEKGTRSWVRVNSFETPIPANDGRGSRFYAAVELPAGSYRFTSWSLIKTEGAAAKEPKEPLAFTIGKGEVLYVGNFNVIRVRATGQFRDRFAEDVQAFRKWYPWLEGMDIKSRPLAPTVWGTPDSAEGK